MEEWMERIHAQHQLEARKRRPYYEEALQQTTPQKAAHNLPITVLE